MSKRKERRTSPYLAVDAALIKKRKILLVCRSIPPGKGYWVLPGGHVNYGEKVEDALQREVKEELGISVSKFELFGVYSDPQRDPRYHLVTIVYLIRDFPEEIKLNYENSKFRFFPLDDLPRKMGFDHRKIVSDICRRIKYRSK